MILFVEIIYPGNYLHLLMYLLNYLVTLFGVYDTFILNPL